MTQQCDGARQIESRRVSIKAAAVCSQVPKYAIKLEKKKERTNNWADSRRMP
jgi:hypothetical protein